MEPLAETAAAMMREGNETASAPAEKPAAGPSVSPRSDTAVFEPASESGSEPAGTTETSRDDADSSNEVRGGAGSDEGDERSGPAVGEESTPTEAEGEVEEEEVEIEAEAETTADGESEAEGTGGDGDGAMAPGSTPTSPRSPREAAAKMAAAAAAALDDAARSDEERDERERDANRVANRSKTVAFDSNVQTMSMSPRSAAGGQDCGREDGSDACEPTAAAEDANEEPEGNGRSVDFVPTPRSSNGRNRHRSDGSTVADDESEASLFVLMRYMGCTSTPYGQPPVPSDNMSYTLTFDDETTIASGRSRDMLFSFEDDTTLLSGDSAALGGGIEMRKTWTIEEDEEVGAAGDDRDGEGVELGLGDAGLEDADAPEDDAEAPDEMSPDEKSLDEALGLPDERSLECDASLVTPETADSDTTPVMSPRSDAGPDAFDEAPTLSDDASGRETLEDEDDEGGSHDGGLGMPTLSDEADDEEALEEEEEDGESHDGSDGESRGSDVTEEEDADVGRAMSVMEEAATLLFDLGLAEGGVSDEGLSLSDGGPSQDEDLMAFQSETATGEDDDESETGEDDRSYIGEVDESETGEDEPERGSSAETDQVQVEPTLDASSTEELEAVLNGETSGSAGSPLGAAASGETDASEADTASLLREETSVLSEGTDLVVRKAEAAIDLAAAAMALSPRAAAAMALTPRASAAAAPTPRAAAARARESARRAEEEVDRIADEVRAEARRRAEADRLAVEARERAAAEKASTDAATAEAEPVGAPDAAAESGGGALDESQCDDALLFSRSCPRRREEAAPAPPMAATSPDVRFLATALSLGPTDASPAPATEPASEPTDESCDCDGIENIEIEFEDFRLVVEASASSASESTGTSEKENGATVKVREVDALLSKTRAWLVRHGEAKGSSGGRAGPPLRALSTSSSSSGNGARPSALSLLGGDRTADKPSIVTKPLSPRTIDTLLGAAKGPSPGDGAPKKSVMEQLAEIRAKQRSLEERQLAKAGGAET